MARKMKDSGIEWIGEIPEGWTKNKVIRLFDTISSGTTPKNITSDFPVVNWIQSGDITGSFMPTCKNVISANLLSQYSALKVYPAPFIIIAMYGASVGNASISLIDGCVNQACCVLSSPSCNLYYAFYVIKSAQSYLVRKAVGGGQPNISQETIKQLWLPIPPLSTQDIIVRNLDATYSKINDLLTSVHASIGEYKKLKQAVITQAVTKGVRGERVMKDSGVEWIGKIPRDFDPVQLKFFCKLITDGTHFSPTTVENGWPYITAGDVHGIGLDYNSAKRISEEDFQLLVAQGCQPLKGDVLLVKDGATTGRVGFVDSDTPCVILSSVAMLRPADSTDGHYLMYLLASDFLQKQILVSMAGSAMPRTTLTKLTKYIGLLPPLHEQKEIANYLDAKCAEIDKLIAKKEQLVKELESYKKSLIYEVVTGKREV